MLNSSLLCSEYLNVKSIISLLLRCPLSPYFHLLLLGSLGSIVSLGSNVSLGGGSSVAGLEVSFNFLLVFFLFLLWCLRSVLEDKNGKKDGDGGEENLDDIRLGPIDWIGERGDEDSIDTCDQSEGDGGTDVLPQGGENLGNPSTHP